MSYPACDHLKQGEDGVYRDSPALRRQSFCYSHLKARRSRLDPANSAHNSFALNHIPITATGSILYAAFRLSPPMLSRLYEQGEGEGYRSTSPIGRASSSELILLWHNFTFL